jgi:hypothetical protein
MECLLNLAGNSGDTWNLRFDLKLFDLKCRLDLTPVPYPLGCAKQFLTEQATKRSEIRSASGDQE